jgi:hypothetical protein
LQFLKIQSVDSIRGRTKPVENQGHRWDWRTAQNREAMTPRGAERADRTGCVVDNPATAQKFGVP